MDAALDAVMLGIAARLGGGRIRPVRMLLAALMGAGLALAARRLMLSRAQIAVLWLPAAFVMQAAAQGRRALVHPVRHVGLLLCAAGLLGGTVTALLGATGSLPTAYALGGVCMAGMTANLARARRVVSDVRQAYIVCRWRGRTAEFEAMADSGNTLRDYLTHLPVIVMPAGQGKKLFGIQSEVLRPIFADTAGGRQMMELLMPEEITVCTGEREAKVTAAVALCKGLSKDAPALIPASLLENMEDIKT